MHAIWLDNTKSPVATVKEKRNEHRDLEACPQKNVVRVTHSRMSENAFFEHGRTFLSSLLFVLWRKTDTLTWKRNACMLHWPIFLVSCACGPTLETKSHASAPREDSQSRNKHWYFYARNDSLISSLPYRGMQLLCDFLSFICWGHHTPNASWTLCPWSYFMLLHIACLMFKSCEALSMCIVILTIAILELLHLCAYHFPNIWMQELL